MRLFEILLLASECLVLLVLAIPRLRAVPRAPMVALLPLVLTALQWAVEGARWQMVPAYALGLLFALVLLLVKRGPEKPSLRFRLLRGSGLLLGSLALLVAAALPALLPVFKLPVPTGPYAIGTLTYHWVDSAREEVFTPAPGDHREQIAQIWYPAQPAPGSARAPYVENGHFPSLARQLHLPGFFFDHLKYVKTHARTAAPVADGGGKFPVLVFAAGRGGFRQHNMFQVEELVSHGYVVATIDQPYAGSNIVFPDGREIAIAKPMLDFGFIEKISPYLGEDAVFTLNQLAKLDRADPRRILTGRLDLDRAGMFGASLGGMTTSEACRLDRRFRACLILDAPIPPDVVASGLKQPTMFISRGADSMRREGLDAAYIENHQKSMRTLFASLPGDGYLLSIPGMFHANISDFPYIMAAPAASALGITGPADARQVHRIMNAYSLAFFDHYLKGENRPLLERPSPWPEARLDRR